MVKIIIDTLPMTQTWTDEGFQRSAYAPWIKEAVVQPELVSLTLRIGDITEKIEVLHGTK